MKPEIVSYGEEYSISWKIQLLRTGLRRELQVNGFRYRDSVSEAGGSNLGTWSWACDFLNQLLNLVLVW